MKLILGTSHRDVELMETPGLAVVEPSLDLINRITQLSEGVETLNVDAVVETNDAISWTVWDEDEQTGKEKPGKQLRITLPTLHVSKLGFWWECFVEFTYVKLSTDPVFFGSDIYEEFSHLYQQTKKMYVVEYSIPCKHVVQVGIEASSSNGAIAIAKERFELGSLWDDTDEVPLLCDDHFDDADNTPLSFSTVGTVEEVSGVLVSDIWAKRVK